MNLTLNIHPDKAPGPLATRRLVFLGRGIAVTTTSMPKAPNPPPIGETAEEEAAQCANQRALLRRESGPKPPVSRGVSMNVPEIHGMLVYRRGVILGGVSFHAALHFLAVRREETTSTIPLT